jgi:hypothetical protein
VEILIRVRWCRSIFLRSQPVALKCPACRTGSLSSLAGLKHTLARVLRMSMGLRRYSLHALTGLLQMPLGLVRTLALTTQALCGLHQRTLTKFLHTLLGLPHLLTALPHHPPGVLLPVPYRPLHLLTGQLVCGLLFLLSMDQRREALCGYSESKIGTGPEFRSDLSPRVARRAV